MPTPILDTAKQIYDAAVDADLAFQEALEAEYGKHGGQSMRYSYVLPSRLALLRAAKLEADEKWLKFMREHA